MPYVCIFRTYCLSSPLICRSAGTADSSHSFAAILFGIPGIFGTAVVELLGTNLKVRVFGIAHKANKKQPIELMSTDTSRSAPQVCQIYARRWDIAVCFKTLKQQLGLYELQLRSYVAIVAFCSVTFLRCIMLSYYHRSQIDDRTLPGVFYECIRELKAATVQACLELLVDKLIEACMADPLKPAAELIPNITEVIDQFITLLRAGSPPPVHLQLKCDS